MKILVDAMPENAAKCKFHGDRLDETKYKCRVTGNICPMSAGQTCRVLKPFSECISKYLR